MMKKLISIFLAVAAAASFSLTAFASAYTTPAEACAGVTGMPIEAIVAERETGKSYGTIAKDAGKLEEFKQATYEMKEENLKEMVRQGLITQGDADECLGYLKERQAACDSNGNSASVHCGNREGFNRTRKSKHHGNGRGQGGLRDGSCRYQ